MNSQENDRQRKRRNLVVSRKKTPRKASLKSHRQPTESDDDEYKDLYSKVEMTDDEDDDEEFTPSLAPQWIPARPTATARGTVVQLKPYICVFPGCGKAYSKPSRLGEHERVHTDERPFKCHIPGCKAAFFRESHFAIHLKGHVRDLAFKCSQAGCTAAFYTRDKLVRHLKSHNSITVPSSSTKTQSRSTSIPSPSMEASPTEVVEKSDLDLNAQEESSIVDVETLMRIAEEIEASKPYACSWAGCTERYAKHQRLKSHICIVHLGTKPYPCTHEGCDKSFPTPSKLWKHLLVHSETLRYGCGIEGCSSFFAKWSQLQKHNKDVHKSIPCLICNKKILSRNMSAHLKIHDTSRPQVNCTFEGCTRVFSTEQTLAAHVHLDTPKQRKARKDAIRPNMLDSIVGFAKEDLDTLMPHVCPVPGCLRRFASLRLFRRHLKSKQHDGVEFEEVSEQDSENDLLDDDEFSDPTDFEKLEENKTLQDLIELTV
ncbi:hypothetical protein BGZ94_003013 [Podila epigama]|nr:hypothetical protein BGZ94_003013 [Podila epigama]